MLKNPIILAIDTSLDESSAAVTRGRRVLSNVVFSQIKYHQKYQLLIYQLAAEKLFPQKIDCLAFYYLDNNSEVEFLGSQEELNKTKEKIINTITEIKKGEFPPKPSALCKFCDFYNICEFRKS